MAESRTEDLFIDLIKGTQKDFEPQSRFESYMKCIINKSDPAGTPTPESRKDVLMRTYAEQVYNGGGGSGAETDLKKYVDDNFVKKVTTVTQDARVYGLTAGGEQTVFKLSQNVPEVGNVAQYTDGSNIRTSTPINDLDCANKKYVDDADKDLRLKLSNLEQALNGYILDTTKESYADLDSAVLKNSVAVGDNVYPIADKTRALVTRIEGKTTKMVQLLDKSKFSATTTSNGVTFTNNGNGSVTVTGTVIVDGVAVKIYSISNLKELIKGHKYLLIGCPEGGDDWTYMLRLNLYNPGNHGWSDNGNGCIFTFDMESYDRDNGGIYIYERTVGAEINRTYTPQFFDLTAMNREDITSVEQFKAEFPYLYPYENGNIYPAKISGVKFTGKNLLDFKTVSAMEGNPMGISYSVVGNEVHIVGTLTEIGSVNIIKTSNLGLVGHGYKITAFDIRGASAPSSVLLYGLRDIDINGYIALDNNSGYMKVGQAYDFYFKVMVSAITPTAYEPYIEPVSVTLPETYELHGIGDYKDYLEITKNENNELYTLKKVQSVEVNEGEKTITPLATPVETVIATNLTYEQVTAIRHNGGLIEVEGNTNKGYARPTIKNTVVYRLTAANTTEG